MTFTHLMAGACAAFVIAATPLFAADITIKDAYVRSATPSAKSGAAFMMIMNTSDQDDVLIAAETHVAKRVELHTHKDAGNGVMQMREIEGGINLPAGGMYALKRGGDHIMLMGLTAPLEQGSEITVTLTFENAGEMQIQIPVDHARKPDHGAMDHSSHSSDS